MGGLDFQVKARGYRPISRAGPRWALRSEPTRHGTRVPASVVNIARRGLAGRSAHVLNTRCRAARRPARRGTPGEFPGVTLPRPYGCRIISSSFGQRFPCRSNGKVDRKAAAASSPRRWRAGPCRRPRTDMWSRCGGAHSCSRCSGVCRSVGVDENFLARGSALVAQPHACARNGEHVPMRPSLAHPTAETAGAGAGARRARLRRAPSGSRRCAGWRDRASAADADGGEHALLPRSCIRRFWFSITTRRRRTGPPERSDLQAFRTAFGKMVDRCARRRRRGDGIRAGKGFTPDVELPPPTLKFLSSSGCRGARK